MFQHTMTWYTHSLASIADSVFHIQVVTHGETRDEAIDSMIAALDGYVIRGAFGRSIAKPW